jgi:hypothetical protein
LKNGRAAHDRPPGGKEERSMTEETKKEWSPPRLTVLGDVETITLQKVKNFGGFDGFILQNQSISG